MPKLNDALGMKVGSQPVKRVYQGSTVVLNGIENLAPNPSFETTTTNVEVRRNLTTRPTAVNGGWSSNNPATHVISLDATVQRRAGVSSRKCYYNGTAGINVAVLSLYSVGSLTNASVDRLPVTAGTAYTTSVYVRASYANTRYQMSASFYDASNVSLGSISTGILTTTLTANTWGQLVQSNIVAPANAVSCFLNLNLYTPSAQANGAQLTDFGWATDICFEAGSAKIGDYFDGTTGGDTDLTPSWLGTANASASVLNGVGITNHTSGVGVAKAFSSTKWKVSGTKSLRLSSRYAGTGTAYVELSNQGSPRGLAAGKTYTLLTTCYIDTPQATNITTARGVQLVHKIGPAAYVTTIGPQAVNTSQTATNLRFTFTIPVGATEWYLRIQNGGVYGDSDVWFDNLMIVEGTYAGQYRDGSNAGWVWSGTANNSSSYGLG